MASSIFINPSVDSGSPSTSLIPTSDNTYDLGSSTFRWRSLYIGTSIVEGGALALGTTSTDGIIAQNTTAATAGATVQMSPRVRWTGTAWNSSSVASETDSFFAEALPVTAAGTTSLSWRLGQIIAGGAVTYPFTIGGAGDWLFPGGAAAGASGPSIGMAAAGRLYFNGRLNFYTTGSGLITAEVPGGNGIGLDVTSAAVLKVRNQAQNAYGTVDAGSLSLAGAPAILSTAATVSSGFGSGTAGTIVSGSTSFVIRVTVGTNAGGTTGVLGLPTATTFWNCFATDMNNPADLTRQTSSSSGARLHVCRLNSLYGAVLDP